MTKKKIVFGIFLLVFFLTAIASADYVGKSYVCAPDEYSVEKGERKEFHLTGRSLERFLNQQIEEGNLVPFRYQTDSLKDMEHIRYAQFYRGLPVFGGQIVYHLRGGIPESINGEFYQIDEIDIIPTLSGEEAADIYRLHLGKSGLKEKTNDRRLGIFPVSNESFRLAYEVTLTEESHYSMTAIVDAHTGEILFQYSNIHFDEPAIGLGYNYHGLSMKLATTLYSDGYYYLYDEKRVRPYNHYTIHFKKGYIPGDDDNYWDFDGTLVSAHALVGFVYDFYYKFFGRNGINNNNLDTIVYVHNNKYKDNAFWNGESLNFCVPGKSNLQPAACLDIVCHEYTHGITDYTSDLVYAFEPGALNESFSDIMGATAEFYWYPEGEGLYMADWYIGEDARPYYSIENCRNLADPNTNSQLGHPNYPDPCHLSQKYNVPYEFDSGGVHLNATIYAHAFYLLANGGKNRVSKIRVNGIGIEKAANIFYTAWVYYLTPYSDFMDAANALLQVAYSKYGAGSNEYLQTIRAMEAIGWIVN